MNYIDPLSNKIESIHQVRSAFPRLSLPDGIDFPDLGRRLINTTPQPDADTDHYVATDNPIEVDGYYYEAWRQVYIEPPVPEVPQEISRFQARMQLHAVGKFQAADDYCMSPGAPIAVREAWLCAQVFRRYSENVLAMKGPLNFTDEHLDAWFTAGSKIEG